jgi:hypothetical protein
VPGAAVPRVAQGRFCFVNLDIRNDGRKPATFSERLQVLFDKQNRRFGPDGTPPPPTLPTRAATSSYWW